MYKAILDIKRAQGLGSQYNTVDEIKVEWRSLIAIAGKHSLKFPDSAAGIMPCSIKQSSYKSQLQIQGASL